MYGMYSWVDHIQEHTTSLNKFKKKEIISNILPDHSDMKLEINHTHIHSTTTTTTTTKRLTTYFFLTDKIPLKTG